MSEFYYSIGAKYGQYLKRSLPNKSQLQALLGDLLAGDELLTPMRDVVSRQSFQSFIQSARAGSGKLQRDALLMEISTIYLPEVIDSVKSLINGILNELTGKADEDEEKTEDNEQYASTDFPLSPDSQKDLDHVNNTRRPAPKKKIAINQNSSALNPSAREIKALPKNRTAIASIVALGAIVGLTAGGVLGAMMKSKCSIIAKSLYERDGASSEAQRIIRENNKLCQEDAGFLLARSRSRHATKDYTSALRDSEKAISKKPGNAHAHYYNGSYLMEFKKFEDAIGSFTKAIELQPRNALYYRSRAVAKNAMDEHLSALTDINKAIQLEPTNGDLYVVRGLIRDYLNEAGGACLDFKKAKLLGHRERELLDGGKATIDDEINAACKRQ